MGTRDRQENAVGPESIEAHFDRVSTDRPPERTSAENLGATGGSGRTGGGMGVSRGDYTDAPEAAPEDAPADARAEDARTEDAGKDTGA
jgi:hypothetical protein